jgi:predicted CXXCH cytochrome family protein
MSETSKQRQSRIDLGYYRVPDVHARRRGRLTLLALVIAGAWIAIAPIWSGGRFRGVRFFQQSTLASKGPLARPHAIWESHCETCHIAFTPVNGSRWAPSLPSRPHAGDERCQNCHAGPIHHASQLEKDVPSCAECHRDHRGQDASLLAMDDTVCTSCHRNLSGTGDLKTTARTVTRFNANPDEHPGFTPPHGVPGPDSGRIKFSHARHMAKGLTMQPEGIPFTFASLDAPDRARYGWTLGRDSEPIQLQCDSCHRLDQSDALPASRIAGDSAGPRSAGDSMQPITYENDCRACHPLPFDPKDSQRQLRHGLKPQELVDDLRRFYAGQVVEADPALLQRFVPPRPMPGWPLSEVVTKAGESVEKKTLAALRRLFGSAVAEDIRSGQGLPLGRGGCVECHELTPSSTPLTKLKAASSLDIKPVIVRSLWYESARFNHASHRALDCAACHAGAAESKDQAHLLLPDVGSCVSCHAPATTRDGRPQGGASTSCVECHRYHDGAHPGQGVGATARRGKVEMSLDQFLEGGPPSAR